MNDTKEQLLKDIFRVWAKNSAETIDMLPPSGSHREYYRVSNKNVSAIGVYNTDYKENLAFLSFTRSFKELGLKVPQIYEEDLENNIYLIEDIGNETLFDRIKNSRESSKEFWADLVDVYKQVIEQMPHLQVRGDKKIDYSVCYPRSSFDQQSMMWDLNYFKYYFLKLANIPFDEQLLEDDYSKFVAFLLEAPRDFFLYRDLQSSNVMIYNDEPWFIDYQGGRKGALQYDLASLLYDAKANMPNDVRTELLEYYITSLKQYMEVDEQEFKKYYYAYALIRMMQAMGAFGFRGFYERKTQFLQSIPFALRNLEWFIRNIKLPIEVPELWRVFNNLVESKELRQIALSMNRLKININSFSYKKGLPDDQNGNGGGHIFDCRALPNPGRLETYRNLTGKDQLVINFLEKKEHVNSFFAHVAAIVSFSVNNYLERGFSNLMVSFGCTGGQHRSVYFAERMERYLLDNYDLDVTIQHREL